MMFFSHSSRIRILQLTLASLLGVGGGGGSNTPIGASCYRNRVKLRPLGLHLFFLTSSCLANRKSFLTNKGKLKTNPGGIVACSVAHMCPYFVTADTFSLVKSWLSRYHFEIASVLSCGCGCKEFQIKTITAFRGMKELFVSA